ncbi:unnamed protein product [Prunus armeniaca]
MNGMMMVALTPNHQIAAIVSSFFTSFWNLFSGFLISRPLIPVWWRWYYWGSPIAWTIYGIFASQFGDIKTVIDTPQGPQRVDLYLKENLGYEHDFVGSFSSSLSLPMVSSSLTSKRDKLLHSAAELSDLQEVK